MRASFPRGSVFSGRGGIGPAQLLQDRSMQLAAAFSCSLQAALGGGQFGQAIVRLAARLVRLAARGMAQLPQVTAQYRGASQVGRVLRRVAQGVELGERARALRKLLQLQADR